MLKNTNKYQTLLAVCLLTLSACSTNETLTDSPIDQSKTPIELTAGIIGENAATTRGLTRTVTNDSPYGSAATAFSSGTSLYMVIKSENETSTTSTQYTRTIGYAQETAPTPANSTTTGFASAYQRYWEDTQSPARDSKLSIYAACVPGYYLNGTQTVESPTGTQDATTAWTIGTSNTYTNTWGTGLGATTIAWPLRGTAVGSQDATFLINQDLCFSNNVSKQNTTVDNRLKFNGATNKFTSGRMVFHHALTQVVFKIIKGEGFGTGTGVFNFTNDNENIVLTGFNTAGKLDISTGDFSNIDNTTPITSLASSTEDGFAYVLTCLMLPGSALTSENLNEIYFTIDDNLYHIKKNDLATALNDKTVGTGSGQVPALATGSTMRPGVKYIFTMTVSKKGIDKLSASVVPWASVEANGMTPSNARISVSVMTNGQKQTGTDASFDLYRSPYVNSVISDEVNNYTWGTGYTSNKAQLIESTTTEGEYTAYTSKTDLTTKWYWPDNKTFYHFRTVRPVNHTVTENTTTGDYIPLTGDINYTDVCWGAPFSANADNLTIPLNGEKLYYSTTSGFDNIGIPHQISKAIGPTTSAINMLMFHMMSDVTINLTTTTGSDAVNLNGATISLSNIHPTGTVLMGNGLVTATGTPGNVSPSLTYNSTNNTSKVENYGFVPQTLEDVTAGNDVVLTITTADNNRYIVDMKDVKFTALSFNNNLIANPYTVEDGKCKINRWYPNFKYTYTFQLKKTGIETISATINDWENIPAETQTVQIK